MRNIFPSYWSVSVFPECDSEGLGGVVALKEARRLEMGWLCALSPEGAPGDNDEA